MVASIEHISEQLFKIVKGFGHSIILFTEDGKKTVDPTVARRFYATDIKMMITLEILDSDAQIIVNLSKGTDIDSVKDMLSSLRHLANRYIIEYTVKTFGKSISPRDFAYQAKTVKESDMKNESTMPADEISKMKKSIETAREKIHLMQPAAQHQARRMISYYQDKIDAAEKNKVSESDMKSELDKPGTVRKVRGKHDTEWWRGISPEGKVSTFADRASAHKFAKPGNPDNAKVDEGKWDYPKDITKTREVSDMGSTNAATNRQKRKEWRKKVKAKQHSAHMVKSKEGVQEGFSGWHGTARKSVNELGDARLVVRHCSNVQEEKRGARTRQIEAIFIENNAGERFKFPTNNITAAKAMVRHVKEGGTPFDDFGQYIYESMAELNELKKFQRKTRRNDFFEDVNIVTEINDRIKTLRGTLTQISGPKGYGHHFETFSRNQPDVPKEKLDELMDNVTVRYFDESISASLPYVARIIETMRGRKGREEEVIDFAQYVMANKDNIQTSRPIDSADPDSPGNQKFRDPAAAISAWVNYLAPLMSDDVLANKMMQASDSVFDVGSKHQNIAAAAINVIRQRAQSAPTKAGRGAKESIVDSELSRINETFGKYTINNIFKA